MSSIAISRKLDQPDGALWLAPGPDWQIGTIGTPLELQNPGWFRTTLRALRKAIRYGFLGILIAIAAILVLFFVLDVVTHLWFLPLALAWQAIKPKRNIKPATADDSKLPAIGRGCIRTRRG